MSSPSHSHHSAEAPGMRGSAIQARLLHSVSFIVPMLGLALFFLYPLALVVYRSFLQGDGSLGLGNFASVLAMSHIPGVLANSLVMSSITTVVSILLGFAIAYMLQRTTIVGRAIIMLALLLPLLAPSLVQALGLLFLFGRNGLVNQATGWDMQIYGLWGLVIANTMYALPQAVMIIQASLRHSDVRYYDAAMVMGASNWRRFVDITLPNAKFGLLSAAFVVFTVTITDFGNAAVIGGDYRVLATEIYAQVVGQMNFSMGAVIGIFLLIPTGVAFYIEKVASQRQFGGGSDSAIPVRRNFLPARDIPLGTVTHFTGFFLIAVVATVVYASFVQLWPYRMSLTLDNYNITTQGGYTPLWTSLLVSTQAAVIGVVLLFALVLAQRGLPRAAAKAVYLLAIVPVGVPGLVLGLSYVLSFNVGGTIMGALYGSALLIAFCNFYHYHSQGFLTMVAGIRTVPKSLEESVTCLGGSPLQGLRDAILPIMLPTLVAVFFFLFMRSMVTLSAVIFLITPSLSVGAVSVLRLDQAGFTTQAAAFSVCIMLLVLFAMGAMKLTLLWLEQRGRYSVGKTKAA
ncbi:ABC transporter permease subunit [Fodinicurvata sediminis]|uniref:ABC transporter permease subunit n=1 Tax=Fodinicurvata sediminis TaxID=1121832 RepID=UPI0003B59489|nr:ABC transporter permease subunit [Fodinicurvata sediminis]